jgi:hypothetical protein
MSRRAVVASMAGAILLAGLGAPAVAGPIDEGEKDPTTICLRLEPESGAREGVCVWVPIKLGPIRP